MVDSTAPASRREGGPLADCEPLVGSRLLRGLAERELAALAEELDQIALPAATVVIREGDDADTMYFVLSGTLRARRGAVELETVGPGEHFGELALFGGTPRAATIEAETPVRLARLTRARFVAFAKREPGVALRFLQAVVGELGAALASMTDNVGSLLRERSLPRRATVEITLGAETRSVTMGTRVGRLLPERDRDGHLVVAAEVDRALTSLEAPLLADALVEPVTTSSPEGRDVVRRTLGLLVLEAAARVAPEVALRLGPSVVDGQVVRVVGSTEEREALARALLHEMRRLAGAAVPVREELWAVAEAKSYFDEHHEHEAALLLRAHRAAEVSLATLGTVHARVFGPLLPSTRCLEGFGFHLHPDGLLLEFPPELRRLGPSGAALGAPLDPIATELSHPRFASPMARAHAAFLEALGMTSVGAFNEACVSGRVSQIIRVSEGFHEKRIGAIADEIARREGQVRVICIAGPSSSGKTTFIKRLTVQLEINHLRPLALSLDDYYVDRHKTPRDEAGELDFEALEALDLAHLQEHLRRMLRGEAVKTARYDFRTGTSHPEGGPELRLAQGDVLLLEGIHGLNPALLGDAVAAGERFRVFIHPATTLPFDRLTTMQPEDQRLLRRIVRDRHGRNHKASDTIARWPSVRRGEARHIFPYLPFADEVFDSALVYEPSVLKVYADRYLLEVQPEHPSHPTALRLRRLVDQFVTIYPDHVPPTSIVREFIGGSGFEY
jgi:uridine kinase